MINNMHFNPYSIPTFISSALILSFGIFAFLKNHKSKLIRIILFWCLSIFVWLFSYSLCYSSGNEFLAEVFSKIAAVGVMFVATLAYHFTIVFLELRGEYKILYSIYLLNIILTPLFLFTDYFLSGSNKYFFGYYGKASHLYPFYLIFFFLIIARTIFLLFVAVKYKNSTSQKQIQTKYVLACFFIASLACIDYFPKFGIGIYPFGYVFVLFWFFITTYAVLQHHLMDINIVIQKSFVYSVLIAVITATYFIFVFLAERFFQGMVGYTSLIVSLVSAFVIALFFNPLRNKIQRFADRIFLGKDPLQIAKENELLRQELERADKLRAVATFASGMAHEIKNPLTALKTFSEYLPEKYQDPQFVSKFSYLVKEQVDRIDNLVHQLLDFSKPQPLKSEPTNIIALLNDTLDLLSNDLLKHNIRLVKDCPGTELIIKIDSNQIKQALLNLFLNAIEAMPEGGVLTISTKLETRKILISIKDTGCGIAKKDLEHIFEPFYTTKEKGSGLGLSIVYNIIREHKGLIKTESRLREGAKFVIELPIEIK